MPLKDIFMGKELFDNIPNKVVNLLMDVKNGRVGLPDLQRPFVWKDNKVRDLLDSMMKGYPIGYIMLWSAPTNYENTKVIGEDDKIYKKSEDLVIDGQQRLTALLASMYGVKIKDKNFKDRNIKISFNPLTREFAVWSQAYERDSEWISEISQVFQAEQEHTTSKFRKTFIKELNESKQKKELPILTEDEEDLIENNLNALLDLNIYSLPTLKINSEADEEDVADIFVRVNSGGQTLTEKNFIETLLAVYDNDIHDKICDFCAESRIPVNGTSYNQLIEVDPAHLIRMAVGIGFKRARLRYAYMLLRGKDLKTKEITDEVRENNLAIFRNSIDTVCNLNNWHAFLNIFSSAGYLRGNIIASQNAIVFSYILYLIGKYEYKVPSLELQKIIRKWIFMATLTVYYSGSTESTVEKQFADLRDIKTAQHFIDYLDRNIKMRLTDDYFNLILPNELNTSAAISPAWFGYIASINILGTPMLFSNTPQAQYFIAGTSGDKNSIDKHHIFPKHYLEKIGFDNDRDRNQIANFTYLDYATNIDISDNPPTEYVERFKCKLGDVGYKIACEQNALPEGFEHLNYLDFLAQRRTLMAKIIKKAFVKLCE